MQKNKIILTMAEIGDEKASFLRFWSQKKQAKFLQNKMGPAAGQKTDIFLRKEVEQKSLLDVVFSPRMRQRDFFAKKIPFFA